MGSYNEVSGSDLEMADWSENAFWVLDNLGEDYTETEAYAYWKGAAEAAKQDLYTYDIAYTSDMRAIPRFNERGMVIDEGRLLTAADTKACVVSNLFLETNQVSIGDKINIKLGDRLKHQNAWFGTRALVGKNVPKFVKTVELEIVGAYRFTDDFMDRDAENAWSYTSSTVFVPASLLPVEVPKDYEPIAGEFSVFAEDAHDIEEFRDAVEALAAETGLGLRFSDGGWMSVKNSLETGRLASFLTTALYVFGAALALFLAVYLYIGRNKKTYAIMRMLGVPDRKAENAVVLPLCIVSAPAVSVGGICGLACALRTEERALAGMAEGMPEDYTPLATLPFGVIILCLVLELLFIAFVSLRFLQKMKNVPPLELLHENARGKANRKEAGMDWQESASAIAGFDITKLPAANGLSVRRTYHAPRQVSSYILRHMRRDIGKTAVSLMMVIVLAAGIGVFVLARTAYRDAFHEVDVKGRATGFSSSSIAALPESGLAEDVYYYNKLSVCANGTLGSSMTLTNDFARYMGNGCAVTYDVGYDSSVFDGTGAVCLLGQTLAEKLGVSPGGEVALLTDELYAFMRKLYEDEQSLREAVERAGKVYKVVGVVETEDEDIGNGIFAVANDAAETLYGQPFPIGYCEFTLADNEKLGELNSFLDEQRKQGMEFAPMASFFVDPSGLENAQRIRDILESLFPLTVTAAILLGLLGPGLVILQSAKEAAFLRILGSAKKRARCMLALEQVLLCVIAMAVVAGALALSDPVRFARSTGTFAVCYGLYLLGCICGSVLAAVYVTGGRILELLQIKE